MFAGKAMRKGIFAYTQNIISYTYMILEIFTAPFLGAFPHVHINMLET